MPALKPKSCASPWFVGFDPAITELKRRIVAGDIDTASITLQCESGKIAVIINSRRASFGDDQRAEAHGALGMLRTKNVAQSMLVQEREDGIWREKPLFSFVERYAQPYRLEWAEFVRVLNGEATPSPSGEDGRLALLIAHAAYQSIEIGRRIELDPGKKISQ